MTDTTSRIYTFFLIFFCLISFTAASEPIQPEDLTYKGAFRVPVNDEFEYSGYALAYYPEGDPGGFEDGYPGSLFILGHDQRQKVCEISIPKPVVSSNKNIEELNTAKFLQGFFDIRPGGFEYLEIPRAGLAYLSAQGNQKAAKLHFCWGQHFQDFEASHGWCELDLSNPQAKGPWHFGEFTNYVSNDYLFEIPKDWADSHVPGQRLASGRFRDGHWSGLGPALFAYQPSEDGSPFEKGSRLFSITPLLLYGIQDQGAIEIQSSESMKMKFFSESDEWSGGVWLTKDNDAAVIFAGTKATGKSWYGFSNGVVWPIDVDESTQYPEVPAWPHDDRGWWSQGIEAQLIFYDTDDLAQVAIGAMKSFEPQPYAVLKIDDYLFDAGMSVQRAKRYLLGAISFDRQRGLLYVVERRADEERSLIHVWQLN